MQTIKYNNVDLFIPLRYVNTNILKRFEIDAYEKEESMLIEKYYNENDNVLELGSCLGYPTALLSKKVNNVISIEANPELRDSLNMLKTKNNLNNVNFIFGYLSNTKKHVTFQTYDLIVAGSADRVDNGMNWAPTQKDYILECIKIGEIPGIEKINALVIDCEGGEYDFLVENINLLQSVNKITIELHEFLMREPGFNNKCINFIKNLGFNVIESISTTYHFEK